MRKTLLLVAVVTLAAAMAVPAAAADTPMQLRFHESIVCCGEGAWVGTVTGDLEGAVRFDGDPAHEGWGQGAAWHFYEVFTISPSGGGFIVGTDAGVYNLKTGMYMANGRVTSASPEYAYLIGYKFHELGVTTDPSVEPIYGEGEAFLAEF